MRRLLVNDQLTGIPGTRTFWNDLQDWFGMEFVGGDYAGLAGAAYRYAVYKVSNDAVGLVIRNASYFQPINADIPTISLLQDIFESGPQRKMQEAVIKSSTATVFNSEFTRLKYHEAGKSGTPGESLIVYQEHSRRTIPLPVDFSLFEPGNTMGLQQAMSLPDGCVCWVGASQGAAGEIKGFDIFRAIVRANPDLNFVAVFKDAAPEVMPPNVRCYVRLSQEDLAGVIGACRVGLCTSRTESQHLAGIEMGACGLPMVAPPVGCYWKREDLPGLLVHQPTPEAFTAAVRAMLASPHDPDGVRQHWFREFNRNTVRSAWAALIEEVEHGDRQGTENMGRDDGQADT